ncbi:TetR/AcrR family transcriptional regulator [Noviherbaspirillum saxi]|uniref:TetR/AcrR family transcriptional regulator n=1 Tax=Noviherbaspirillum saxi TaxID=2320863 RepID=A0A3A3FRB3_9BURK|nr:TetR/AcrR family transcriptional regulator [Noviherbaspirillum saxi]RJF95982.1 TetR/AcrR family transcriptional regulator [Noviherbaspirillum saxi]
MARGRAPGYDIQRETILSRAAQLFASRGYTGTSMNEVAEACGLSKPALYHYFRDKHALLVDIAEGHVLRLESVVGEVTEKALAPKDHLEQLIRRFVEEYADAQDAHRVLTEDIRFLNDNDRERILERERRVVAAFAGVIRQIRPEIDEARLATPLTMLLFGMINWMFTWLKPDGTLTYESMATIVADLFFGGLPAVRLPDKT